MSAFNQFDLVEFDVGNAKGKGQICGKALTEQPVIGATWIVHVLESNIDPATYPYSHIVCPEVNLKKAAFI